MNKENKKLMILFLFLLVSIASFSLAFFATIDNKKIELQADIVTIDDQTLIFNKGDNLFFQVEIDSFLEGTGSVSGTISPSVTFTAKEFATETYNIYLNIFNNSIVYTTSKKIPELILNIFDENGEEITTIDNLDYYNQDGIAGFDITGHTESINISINKEITTNSQTIHEYEFVVTFVNLGVDQSLNLGNGFNAQVIFDKSELSGYIRNLSSAIIYDNGGSDAIIAKGEPDYNKSAISEEDYNNFNYEDSSVYFDEKEHYGTENGMYSLEDDYGMSYYYRGAVDNNWVVFGQSSGKDIYWRVVRVNGDNSVKILYSGTTPPTESQATVMTGTGTQISTTTFNSLHNRIEYSNYMYTLNISRGTGTDSKIKGVLETWYAANMISYDIYISDQIFCYDRDAYIFQSSILGNDYSYISGNGIGTTLQAYGGTRRNGFTRVDYKISLSREDNISPSLKCNNEGDKFSVNGEFGANAVLKYPIGLLTIDESSVAGLRSDAHDNTSNYLYTNTGYWLGSPAGFFGESSRVWSVGYTGSIGGYYTSEVYGVRPVININSDVLVSGNGTWDDPYKVIMN